jgi:hypothetical protein
VFSEGAGGWSDGALVAQLTASDGVGGDGFGQSVATDGATVVALADQDGRESGSSIPPSVLYLFPEPAGGWSGPMHESARLVSGSSTCTELSPASVSGPTVTAICRVFGTSTPVAQALVFSEPAGGWAGTLGPSAELSASSDELIAGPDAVTDGGRTILAGGFCGFPRGCLLVFREPAGGWTGTVGASAKLLLPTNAPPSAIAVSGSTVFAATGSAALDSRGRASVYVFSRPGSTWPATVKPVATLAYPSKGLDAGPHLVASGRTVALTHVDVYGTKDCVDPCSPSGAIDVFGEPARGWSGTLTPQTVGAASGGDIALQDRTVLSSTGTNTIKISDALLSPPPTASALTLTGLGANRPHLRFDLSKPHGPEIVSVTVGLPAGLRFNGSRKLVAAALSITRHHTITLSGGRLTVTLTSVHKTLGVSIGPRAMTESPALLRTIQRQSHAHKRLRRTLTATVTDAAGDTTRLPVRGSAGRPAAAR